MKPFIVTQNWFEFKFTIDNQTFTLYPLLNKMEARLYKKQLTTALTKLQNYYIADYMYDNYSFFNRLKLAIKLIFNK